MLPVLLFTLFVTLSHGHILKMGDCPEVEVMRNFDMDKVSKFILLTNLTFNLLTEIYYFNL